MTSVAISEAGPSTSPSSQSVEPIPLGQSSNGRLSGQFWKDAKKPGRRTRLNPAVKSKSWEAKMAQETKEKATIKYIKDLKEEKVQAEKAYVVLHYFLPRMPGCLLFFDAARGKQ